MIQPLGPGAAVLGISADYHDAAAAVIVDGDLVAAAEEERFTRRKHDPSLPVNALRWCLDAAGVGDGDLAAVAFSSKPLTTYERILREHATVGPRGAASLARAVRVWVGSKLWVPLRVERALRASGRRMPQILFAEHHQSHAASAFYPSPFERAAVLTFDGVGEWTTSSIAHGTGSRLRVLAEQRYPDSLGLLYSTITAQCGFAVNDGEYKVMGLAPYGTPRYVDVLRAHVVEVRDDGSVRLDQRYFDYRAGRRMGSAALDALLGGPPRPPDAPLGQREADLAASVQRIVEAAVLAAAVHAHALTGEHAACLAGGVALNCVANAVLRERGPFEEVWVQPAAGDAGGAPGAALWAWHEALEQERRPVEGDAMRGCRLGPSFGDDEVEAFLAANQVEHHALPDLAATCEHVADRLAAGDVVGWFQGPMEFGPRALGQRSILADPRRPEVVARLNAAIKQREGFRPFAPAVLAERAADWFEPAVDSPYMLFTTSVAEHRRRPVEVPPGADFGALLGADRSQIPACTHVDHSARVQTVDDARSPELAMLLRAWERRTGCPVLVNTSFNGAGEPIVCTPADALRTFRRTGLDLLVLGRHVVARSLPAVEGAA